jgi:hypothetical protein
MGTDPEGARQALVQHEAGPHCAQSDTVGEAEGGCRRSQLDPEGVALIMMVALVMRRGTLSMYVRCMVCSVLTYRLKHALDVEDGPRGTVDAILKDYRI